MKKELLYASSISVTFPTRGANLNQLTLSLYTGEVLGLFGNRYAGKASLFRVLLGQIPIHDGMLLWNGSAENPRPKVIRVGKNSAMADDLLVWENIAMLWNPTATGRPLNSVRMKKMIRLYLEDYQLHMDINKKTSTLSQLDKIAIEILMALRQKVKLLLVDLNAIEGTSQEYAMLKHLLQRIRQEDIAIIVSTHQAEIVSFLSDRIAVLFNGRILKVIRQEETTPAELEKLSMALYKVEKRPPQTASVSRKQVLQVSGLEAGLRECVSFSLYQGEFFALVSPQREMLQILKRRILEGEQEKLCSVTFHGRPVRRLQNGDGVLFLNMQEMDQVIEEMTPLENLCLGISDKAGVWGFENNHIVQCMEQDFYEWYGHKGLLRQKNCRMLYKKDRIAINLFRLRFIKADVIFCNALNVYNDVVTHRMVQDALAALAEAGSAICILASDFAYQEELVERVVVLDSASG